MIDYFIHYLMPLFQVAYHGTWWRWAWMMRR